MKPNLSKSIASYKRTPKPMKGDKLVIKKKKRGSNILGILSTPNGPKKIFNGSAVSVQAISPDFNIAKSSVKLNYAVRGKLLFSGFMLKSL